jgi:hypothetical protein
MLNIYQKVRFVKNGEYTNENQEEFQYQTLASFISKFIFFSKIVFIIESKTGCRNWKFEIRYWFYILLFFLISFSSFKFPCQNKRETRCKLLFRLDERCPNLIYCFLICELSVTWFERFSVQGSGLKRPNWLFLIRTCFFREELYLI